MGEKEAKGPRGEEGAGGVEGEAPPRPQEEQSEAVGRAEFLLRPDAASDGLQERPVGGPETSGPASAAVPSGGGPASEAPPAAWPAPRRQGGGRRLARPEEPRSGQLYQARQRLLLLDTWRRSGLPARDFGALVGVSKYTLLSWSRRFEERGPAGLLDGPRGAPPGSRVDEVTRRSILLLKESHPEYGCERISLMLLRGFGVSVSDGTVAKVLKEEGYEAVEAPTHAHPEAVHRFERSRPNELWQTDLFTFTLKRQNRRVYMVAFLDDHSRFVVGYGLYATQSAALVLEVLRAAVHTWGAPREVLSDNGSQYVTWRGRSHFSRELARRGIRHVVARPRHPQTLGKCERFWGTLWRECVERAVFFDLEDARRRVGQFIDHYNFQRPHQGIEGLVPADRYFEAAPEVRKALAARVAANALQLARDGVPRKPFYLTGQVGGRGFSIHAEGERLFLVREGGPREEIDLAAPPAALPEEVARDLARRYEAWRGELPGGEIPPAVAPHAAPEGPEGYPEPGQEEPGAPGTSPLDGLDLGGGR